MYHNDNKYMDYELHQAVGGQNWPWQAECTIQAVKLYTGLNLTLRLNVLAALCRVARVSKTKNVLTWDEARE